MQPVIALGTPTEKKEEYNVYEMDGYQVYVHKDIKARDNELTIRRTKFFFLENLMVEGIRL